MYINVQSLCCIVTLNQYCIPTILPFFKGGKMSTHVKLICISPNILILLLYFKNFSLWISQQNAELISWVGKILKTEIFSFSSSVTAK